MLSNGELVANFKVLPVIVAVKFTIAEILGLQLGCVFLGSKGKFVYAFVVSSPGI